MTEDEGRTIVLLRLPPFVVRQEFLVHIRPAQAEDQKTITRMIHNAGINPMSLDWHRFLIAEDDGQMIGIGQIKVHGDGSRELASLAVIPSRQRQGIGGEIIRTLLAKETGTMYLTCRARLETYYARFGFRRIAQDEMPPYFRRIMRLARIFVALARAEGPIVMKRD